MSTLRTRRPRPDSSPLLRVRTAASMLALAVGIALVTSVAGAPPAQAHAGLVSSSPTAGSTVTKAPTQVVLVFDGPVSTSFATVKVTNAAGEDFAQKPSVLGATVTTRLKPGLTSGAYKVTYRVVSDDGHPVSAVLGFQVKLSGSTGSSGSAGPSPSTATSGSGGTATPLAPSGSSQPSSQPPASSSSASPASGASQGSWLSQNLAPVTGAVILVLLGGGLLVWERRRR